MTIEFIYDQRLDLFLPSIDGSWHEISKEQQEQILAKWETIRGIIPDRIKEIEQTIELVHQQLTEEEDFDRSCELNLKMAELASTINELWIWFRVTPTMT
ncbi:hypothetical protein [Halalkalibacter akibai]|uniref:Radical SAM protein n=1 Tax=Halalkalibacter akibai (strain ATCC 43226 / DSM 21942 / CIP 109018 / JCM 9157 / 1139) TaxID=1236973 RepID=W4QR63_HALA3|nr:hypothetical protein [Halalkalibacter akibai]GAE34138.1 hypothetical protein JCM9157_1179 [Halalkalibacter akibai JCM 9157]